MANDNSARDKQGEERIEHEPEGGAYIGNRPEMARKTIPGGIDEDDERVAAVDSQSSGAGKEEERVQGRRDTWPAGHREGDPATTDRHRGG